MVIRKLSLDEWFLQYQLRKIRRDAFHLNLILKVDVSSLFQKYLAAGQKMPVNILVLKALGRTAVQHPHFSRMGFRSLWGARFLESSEIRINFPIEIEHHGRQITTAIVIKNPDSKSPTELSEEIKSAKSRPLESFPISNFAHSRKNNFANRLALRLLHRFIMSSPQRYFKMGGGGLSFSSMTQVKIPHSILTSIALGPTGFTFCLNSVEMIGDGTFLHFGIGFDHNCHTGSEMARFMKAFSENLSTDPIL